VDVRRKVAHSRLDATVQCTAVRKMATQAHTRCTYPAIASGQGEQVVNAQRGVLVISGYFLHLG
jgi:hypothetical protein